jgi:hypothetical protein
MNAFQKIYKNILHTKFTNVTYASDFEFVRHYLKSTCDLMHTSTRCSSQLVCSDFLDSPSSV